VEECLEPFAVGGGQRRSPAPCCNLTSGCYEGKTNFLALIWIYTDHDWGCAAWTWLARPTASISHMFSARNANVSSPLTGQTNSLSVKSRTGQLAVSTRRQ